MNEINNTQNTSINILNHFVVGLYAWLAAISLGTVLLDIVYSGLVPDATKALSESADFQLLINVVTFFTALGAIGLSWDSKAARNFLIASLGVTILGLFVYIILSPVLKDSPSLGAGIRIILTGSVSVLAFMGFYKISSVGRD